VKIEIAATFNTKSIGQVKKPKLQSGVPYPSTIQFITEKKLEKIKASTAIPLSI
jgi:hypothetical protein